MWFVRHVAADLAAAVGREWPLSFESVAATRPLVLAWAGNDPSGGAGLAADTAALLSQGCACCPVVTALTVQDTRGLQALNPVDAGLVEQQARAVLADLPVTAFKIGVIGSIENALAIARVLADYPGLPVVLDPVLRAGGGSGGALAAAGMIEVLKSALLPYTTVLTPNADEAARMIPDRSDADAQVADLLELGSEYVLLTGGDTVNNRPNAEVVNTLYAANGEQRRDKWLRLPGRYHGSGCTLASALAGLLARGVAVADAAQQAQAYTWLALKNASTQGRGQLLPERMFWARDGHRLGSNNGI